MSVLAKNIEDVLAAQGEIRAGGTDLMERLRHGVSEGPIVDISRLEGLDEVREENGGVSIGALVRIQAVAEHPLLRKGYPGFAMAAGALATPQIRNAGTLGGSLLQRTRCWYYRHEGISCLKKGGNACPAREGNHQFGVCFDLGPCVFPHPSTLGMCLMAYDAQVEVAEKGTLSMEELYGKGEDGSRDHLLPEGAVLRRILLPKPLEGQKAAYFRSISRARAEWPLVEVMVRYCVDAGRMREVRVVMGGVAPVPLALPKVDAYLEGKAPGAAVFEEAGRIAAQGANPLPQTGYKVQLVEGTVFETLRRADAGIWGGEG